jgi:hypothetical protein
MPKDNLPEHDHSNAGNGGITLQPDGDVALKFTGTNDRTTGTGQTETPSDSRPSIVIVPLLMPYDTGTEAEAEVNVNGSRQTRTSTGVSDSGSKSELRTLTAFVPPGGSYEVVDVNTSGISVGSVEEIIL